MINNRKLFIFVSVLINTSYVHCQFNTQLPLTSTSYEVATISADLDGDSDLDIISAGQGIDQIRWFENLGLGQFSSCPNLITTDILKATYLCAADIDADGDIDILSTSIDDHKLAWYPNDGSGFFGSQIVISNSLDHPASVEAGDLDGDGDLDLVVTDLDLDQVMWFPNLINGVFGPPQTLTNTADGVKRANAVDVDGDNDLDIVAISISDDKVFWIENLGNTYFSSEQIISNIFNLSEVLTIADIDGNGFPDILTADGVDDSYIVFFNQGGGIFSLPQVLTNTADGPKQSIVSDIDGDGDADIMTVSYNDQKLSFYENLGGTNFGVQQVVYSDSKFSFLVAGDFNQDGQIDVLHSREEISISFNQGGLSFSLPQIVRARAQSVRSCFAGDFNGDGNADILAAGADDKVYWFENLGSQKFSGQKIIDYYLDLALTVHAGDIDQDGDDDVIAGGLDRVCWYENLGGGVFGPQQVISTSVQEVKSVYLEDIDNDGDLDAFSASFYDHKISWFENLGAGNYGAQQTLTTSLIKATDVNVVDIDNDNDMDILATSQWLDQLVWFENLGGNNFSTSQLITNQVTSVYSMFPADYDNDGDIDIACGSGGLFYIENLGGGNFQNPIQISSEFCLHVFGGDIDSDSDVDLVCVDEINSEINWYDNLGGGNFASAQLVTNEVVAPSEVYLGNFDNDSSLDLVSVSKTDFKVAAYFDYCIPYISVLPSDTICQGDSVNIFGHSRNLAGTYFDIFQSTSGCDSIIQKTLFVHPHDLTFLSSEHVCMGDSLMIFGNYEKLSGYYLDSLQSINGCDSILVKELVVSNLNANNLGAITICSSDSVSIFGNYEQNAGFYYDTLVSGIGCDSVVSYELIVSHLNTNNLGVITICNSDSVSIFGSYEQNAGFYYDTLVSGIGCDSVVSYELMVNSLPLVELTSPIMDTLCEYFDSLALSGFPIGGSYSGVGVSSTGLFSAQSGLGEHIIFYEYTDSNNCIGTDSLHLFIDQCLGLSYEVSRAILIYPNPSDGYVWVNMNVFYSEVSTLKVFSANGSLVYQGIIQVGNNEFDFSDLEGGLYTFEISHGDKSTVRRVSLY